MGNRIHSDNCLLLFFCCGFLSVLGIIKGIILVGPIFIISLFGFTGVAIILLPHDIILTYRAICKTSIIGINIKILCMLLLPIALISWPFIIAFLSSLFGIFYGLFCPIIYTFKYKDPIEAFLRSSKILFIILVGFGILIIVHISIIYLKWKKEK